MVHVSEQFFATATHAIAAKTLRLCSDIRICPTQFQMIKLSFKRHELCISHTSCYTKKLLFLYPAYFFTKLCLDFQGHQLHGGSSNALSAPLVNGRVHAFARLHDQAK